MRNSSVIGRVAAVAAVVIALAAVAVILLSSGSTYKVRAVFQNASQIVPGDLVEVSGNSIGTVSDISLTPDGQAQLTLKIDSGRVPAAARRHAGDRPRGVAVRHREPLHRPAPRAGERGRDQERRDHPDDRYDERGRPRPAVQHAQPTDAHGASERHPGLGLAMGQARRRGPGGVSVPQPGDRVLERAVSRDQP